MQVVAGVLCPVHFHALLLGGVAAKLLDAAARLRSELVDQAFFFGGRLAQQLEDFISEMFNQNRDDQCEAFKVSSCGTSFTSYCLYSE